MEKFEKEVITKNYKVLIQNIRVYNVVDYLVQEQVLTVQDCQRCTSKQHLTEQDAARFLVNLILESDRPKVFETFVESLEEPYPFLAEQLRTTYSSKITEQRRKDKPLVRSHKLYRQSALVSDINYLEKSDDGSGHSLSMNIGLCDTFDENAELACSENTPNGSQESDKTPSDSEVKCFKDSTDQDSLMKRLSAESSTNSEDAALKDASNIRRNSSDNGPVKRRMGSSRRRMLRASGTSKEAGIEDLRKLSCALPEDEPPSGLDEVDGFEPPSESSLLQEGIHYIFMERRNPDLRVGVFVQELPEGGFIINKILNDGLAIQQTDLQEGDILVYVNGKEIQENSLDEVKDLIDNTFTSPQVIFGVRRSGYFYQEVFDITLERASEDLSYGLRYIFGRSRPRMPGDDDTVYITRVERGSVAETEGVRVGDEILAINHHSLDKIKYSVQVEKLFQESCSVIVRLKRQVYSDQHP